MEGRVGYGQRRRTDQPGPDSRRRCHLAGRVPGPLIDQVGADGMRAPKHGIDMIQKENLGWFVAYFLYYYSRWENHV